MECELKQNYGADCPILVRIGTICDKGELDAIFEEYKPTIVFHAAAHKHVPLMEESCAEAVKNNVFGTLNLLTSAAEHGVERLVQLSTDKAVNPTNVMGATKRVTEMLIQSFARNTQMQCVAVRFGNVLGSHGSVIPLFESQIKNGGPLTLTHPDITRYFMTIPEAGAAGGCRPGRWPRAAPSTYWTWGEPVRIKDLAEKLIRFYGYTPGVDMQIKITGLRPGEKLYEELLMDKERDGMTSTAHHKIFVAPPIVIDDEVFSAQLDALREAALRGGNAEVVERLHEIVETYTPDESARQAGVIRHKAQVQRRKAPFGMLPALCLHAAPLPWYNRSGKGGVRMCTQGEVRAIVADMRARLEGLFPQQQIDAILFGSYARGEAEDGSDIDVMFLVDAPRQDIARQHWRIGEAAAEILLERGRACLPGGGGARLLRAQRRCPPLLPQCSTGGSSFLDLTIRANWFPARKRSGRA